MRTPAIALLVLASALLAAACATAPMTALPDNVKWVDHPAFMGVKLAVLHGNPAQPGPYVVRLSFPADYRVPPHFHPTDESVTVISGSANIGHGDRFDKNTGKRYGTGEFVRVQATHHHYAWTTEDAVIQVHGVGPTGVTWVNPADKPGKM